ncbi:protein TRI1 isoform X2 [Amborella trichopoda]|uniref:protein TRI1 isoform X2 n=1 Tax=Amborella trichopoda TaxID=13333 RepID=UPI0005D3B910|nr:protein TRI1 isoform X2 [Amborella trichopoda]|eukprot:XP_011623913.1 protein TRI1 isoform X2 [Amborella trichopoda]
MSRVFEASRVLMAVAKTKAKSTANPSLLKPSQPKPTAKPARSTSGIFKSIPVSPAMRKFLGVPDISRTDAMKKVWEYIKANNLQKLNDSYRMWGINGYDRTLQIARW